MAFNYDDYSKGEFGETWEPEDGDSVTGVALEIRTATTKYGEKPVLDLEVDGQKVSVWANRILLEAMEEEGVDEGDTVTITYKGKSVGTGKNGDFVIKVFEVEKSAAAKPKPKFGNLKK